MERAHRLHSASVLAARTDLGTFVESSPGRRETYLDRPEQEAEAVEALGKSHLVSILGLPGIGKTEMAREVARRAREDRTDQAGGVRRYHREVDVGLLQATWARAFWVRSPRASRNSLICSISSRDPILLYLDNAEELMRDDAGRRSFADWLEGLLQSGKRTRVLLTSWRWPAGTRNPWKTGRSRFRPSLSRKRTSSGGKRTGQRGAFDPPGRHPRVARNCSPPSTTILALWQLIAGQVDAARGVAAGAGPARQGPDERGGQCGALGRKVAVRATFRG